MKNCLKIISVIFSFALAVNASAGTILQTWDLTNKSPGALGTDYGLRLNNMSAINLDQVTSNHLIFDFERPGHGVRLNLVDTGAGLELQLSGTAYGAQFDNSTSNRYGSAYAGTYQLDFTWRNVEQNAGGYDLIAERDLGSYTQGDGSGTVLGTGGNAAFMGAALNLYDWSGKFDYTLHADQSQNPDASGWLTYGNGHSGDYGFNMVAVVPEPGALSLLGLGLLGLGLAKRRRS